MNALLNRKNATFTEEKTLWSMCSVSDDVWMWSFNAKMLLKIQCTKKCVEPCIIKSWEWRDLNGNGQVFRRMEER